jgi:hypothetical protein
MQGYQQRQPPSNPSKDYLRQVMKNARQTELVRPCTKRRSIREFAPVRRFAIRNSRHDVQPVRDSEHRQSERIGQQDEFLALVVGDIAHL